MMAVLAGVATPAAADLPPFDSDEIWERMRNDPDAARRVAVAYLETELEPGTVDYGHAARLIAISYGMQNRLDEALPYAELAYETALEVGEPGAIARTLHNIGTIHRLQGDIEKAIDIYRRSIDIAREVQAKDVLVNALTNQAELLISYGAVTQALTAANEAERRLDENVNPAVPPVLAHANNLNGRYGKAFTLLDKGEAWHEGELPRHLVAVYSYQRALGHRGLGNNADARQENERCLTALAGLDLPLEMANCLELGAAFAIEDGDLAAAQRLTAALLGLVRDQISKGTVYPVDAGRLRSRLLDLRIDMALRTGDMREAIALRDEKRDIDAELEAAREEFEMALVSAEFANRIRDAELQELRDETRLMEMRSAQQNLLIAGGVGVAVVLGLSALFFYRSARERRRLNGSLEEALKAQTVLARDVKHRAKNNLQILISTLNMRRRREGENTPEAVALSGKVHAMALLQDMLYADDADIGHVDTHEYLVPLVETIAAAHDATSQIATLDIASMDIGTEVASPLGLILTELLSNAFKHAPGSSVGVVLAEAPGDRFCLTVTDDGPGFLHASITDASMGLTLVNDLVAQVRGDIRHEDARPGTRWTLFAPRRTVAELVDREARIES
ncbi:MAG: tetratricopeptide repeat protein [Pseudomonadota bacterium]